MAWKKADWSGSSSKSSQVRCHDDPHLVDLALRKISCNEIIIESLSRLKDLPLAEAYTTALEQQRDRIRIQHGDPDISLSASFHFHISSRPDFLHTALRPSTPDDSGLAANAITERYLIRCPTDRGGGGESPNSWARSMDGHAIGSSEHDRCRRTGRDRSRHPV